MTKVIKLQSPINTWEVGKQYPNDPKERIIASIKIIQKNGEMAYVDWFEIRDTDENIIGEVRAACLESILYE